MYFNLVRFCSKESAKREPAGVKDSLSLSGRVLLHNNEYSTPLASILRDLISRQIESTTFLFFSFFLSGLQIQTQWY